MSLHTSESIPQWELVPREEQNLPQRIAAATGGLLTPANTASILGYKIFGEGLIDIRKGNTLKGVVKIGVGRSLDLIDGWLAEKYGTKSPLGEFVDPAIDGAEIALALPVVVKEFDIPKAVTAMIIGGEVVKSVP